MAHSLNSVICIIMYFFTFSNNDMYEMSCFHLIVIRVQFNLPQISNPVIKKLLMKLYINDNYDSEMIPGKRS